MEVSTFQFAHADQHGLAFGNSDSSKKVFGNDGGVFYGKTQSEKSEIISSRNKNLNTSSILHSWRGSIGNV